MTTTRPPILTGPPPALAYRTTNLPTVRWCIAMLEWVGWSYDDTTKINGYRTYLMTDCNGKTSYLTTYGLRRAAMEMWLQYGVKAQRNFVHPLSGF